MKLLDLFTFLLLKKFQFLLWGAHLPHSEPLNFGWVSFLASSSWAWHWCPSAPSSQWDFKIERGVQGEGAAVWLLPAPPPRCPGGSSGSRGCECTQAVCRSTHHRDRHHMSPQTVSSGARFHARSFRGAMLFVVYSRELSEPMSVTPGLSALHWL